MSAEVKVSGPMFDGRAQVAVIEFSHEIQRAVADKGVTLVRQRLGGVLRHPTGYYESQIQTEQDHIVTDGGVIYGPWLEGVGSRNRTTRFKGYWTFRQTTQEVNAASVPVSEDLLHAKYLRRMQ